MREPRTDTKAPTHAASRARRAKGIAMLLTGARHADVAKACGVSVRQVERWSALPEVREPAAAAEASAPDTARTVLDTAAREAAEGLLAIARDGKASAETRMRAWLAVLDRTGHAAASKHEHTTPAGGAMRFELTIAQAQAGARDSSVVSPDGEPMDVVDDEDDEDDR